MLLSEKERRRVNVNYIKFDPDESYYYQHGMSKRVAETGASWPHYHGLYEIYYLEKGNCTYFIDGKIYSLIPGDIVIIPDGIIHHTKYDDISHSRILINCASRYIPTSVRTGISSGNYLYRNPDITAEAAGLFEKIEKEYMLRDRFCDEIITCYTHSLFYLLLRNSDTCLDIEVKNKVIEQAISYIRENFSSPLTLSSVAGMLSVSPEHFSRMFKKETGLGFSKYLNSLRLQHAEKLLKASHGQSITKIAEDCGFEDSNYFSKKFKEIYGTSPKKVQKQGKRDDK